MSPLVPIGLACGLASAALSEAVLRFGASVLERSLFRALAVGAALRTLWVLALTAWALTGGVGDGPAFVLPLLFGYLLAQVAEGIRYERYFERC